MDSSKKSSDAQYIVVAFFIISMLFAGAKGCNDASEEGSSPDPSDYQRLQ